MLARRLPRLNQPLPERHDMTPPLIIALLVAVLGVLIGVGPYLFQGGVTFVLWLLSMPTWELGLTLVVGGLASYTIFAICFADWG